mmetsp:Transcript_6328/g.14608  ORF Transcript_6328/g.14608 Transcript_6328/m.14608 type:complete len:142 (-) Transcript_6328:1484-1909(-)
MYYPALSDLSLTLLYAAAPPTCSSTCSRTREGRGAGVVCARGRLASAASPLGAASARPALRLPKIHVRVRGTDSELRRERVGFGRGSPFSGFLGLLEVPLIAAAARDAAACCASSSSAMLSRYAWQVWVRCMRCGQDAIYA